MVMENSEDARPVRRVRCPRCHSVLEEPGAPVYQCGGCGTNLRAKNRTGSAGSVPGGSTSTSGTGLPPRTTHLDAADVASTSRSSTPTPPDVRTSWRQATDATTSSRQQHGVASTSSAPDAAAGASRRQGSDATSRRQSGDLVSVRGHGSSDDGASTSTSTPDAANTGRRRQGADATSRRDTGDLVSATSRVSDRVALIEERVVRHESAAASQEARQDYSEGRRAGGAGGAGSPAGVGAVHFSRASKEDVSESLQDDSAEKTMKRQAFESTNEARKKHSGEAALRSAQAAAAQSARDVLRREEDAAAAAAAAAGDKAPSPSRHDVQAENLGPLRNKILQTVDELKGDLSELFSKSPELNAPGARPPRRPKQEEGYVSHAARAARARHAAAAAGGHRVGAARVAKPAPPRGLPSRRYRQCRADPSCHSVQPRPCHPCCCRHHGKPECGSCRGHCCRPRAEEPSAPRKPAPKEAAKRRLAPRNHCRPVLKGAPFIVCSSCFKLVQVPADFAVATKTVRKLRCGSCSTVLSYSYRDPDRKKAYQDSSIDRCSTDGPDSDLLGGRGFPPLHPFAPFVDGFGLSSYSTDDEQPLHVSRNTSFDTIDGAKGVGRLHRLMGYASASELLRHSPDLYESFSERTTPEVTGMGHYDRKGKSVCVDDGYDVDDSDDEDGGALKRSAARGPGWPLPWMPGKGTPPPGAIRIK